MTHNNETNPQQLTNEEIIFSKWLEIEESDTPVDKKQAQIINYLKSALKDESTSENIIYQNVHKMGGKILCRLSFLPVGGKGHFELTEGVFNKYLGNQLGITTINNFASVSTYPDLYYPEQLHYHAMSEVNENHSLLDQTGQQDIQKLINLLKNHLSQLDIAILSNDIKSIFFYVGMLFHSIQDLVVHKGMTSPQHAHLNQEGKCPDDGQEALGIGKKVSNLFMNDFIYARLTAKNDLLEQCNRAGALDSLSYTQIKERKQEIIEKNPMSKLLSKLPFGEKVSHIPFLLAEIAAFSKSAKHYNINKNAITWKSLKHKTGNKLIDNIAQNIFSELPKKAI